MHRTWQNWDMGRVAEDIDEFWRRDDRESRHRAHLVDMLAPHIANRQIKLLEVGCGSGLVYERIVAELLPNDGYLGIDVSEKMLSIARRRYPDGRFRLGDGYDLDFPDGSFDVVICFEVLGHIPEIERFVPELLRVCRGTCLMTIWAAAGDEIVEKEEFIDGLRFLHREYPADYLRRIIEPLLPPGGSTGIVPLPNGVTAVVATVPLQQPNGRRSEPDHSGSAVDQASIGPSAPRRRPAPRRPVAADEGF